jgi:hypothetical protein
VCVCVHLALGVDCAAQHPLKWWPLLALPTCCRWMEEYARRLGDGWYGGCESDSSVKGPLEDAGEVTTRPVLLAWLFYFSVCVAVVWLIRLKGSEGSKCLLAMLRLFVPCYLRNEHCSMPRPGYRLMCFLSGVLYAVVQHAWFLTNAGSCHCLRCRCGCWWCHQPVPPCLPCCCYSHHTRRAGEAQLTVIRIVLYALR